MNNPALVLEDLRPATFDDPGAYNKLLWLEDRAGQAFISVKDYGAKGDGVTDDTAAIQAALDYAASLGGFRGSIVYVPASPTAYMFSNLKMTAWTTLQGSHMSQCKLKRIVGSTGTALREKTSAEGNASGAGGIWVKDISIDGNSTSGNGIDLGNQVSANELNFNAGVERVFVSGFTTGIGMILRCNAVQCSYLWSNSNQEGIKIQGGGSVYHGIWAEGNTTLDLRIQSLGSVFHGIQTEPATGVTSSIQIEGNQNYLAGITIGLGFNITDCVRIIAGANRNVLHHVYCNTNGHTFTNLVNYQSWTAGATGSAFFELDEYVQGDTGNTASWYINIGTGVPQVRSGNSAFAKQNGTARCIVGDDTTSASAGLNGVLLLPFSDGNNYIDSKAQNGGTTVYRCGHNTETGSTRTWLTVTNSTGDAAFGSAVNVGKAFRATNELVPAQITANQNDYAPPGFADAAVLLINSDAARDVTGFGSPTNGRWLTVYNTGAFNITLKHQVTSAAANQIRGRGGADTVLTPSTGVQLYYSPSLTKWVVMTDTL